jgi:hypothetical protein
VIGHDGKATNITMLPGDLVLYESHSVLHGVSLAATTTILDASHEFRPRPNNAHYSTLQITVLTTLSDRSP